MGDGLSTGAPASSAVATRQQMEEAQISSFQNAEKNKTGNPLIGSGVKHTIHDKGRRIELHEPENTETVMGEPVATYLNRMGWQSQDGVNFTRGPKWYVEAIEYTYMVVFGRKADKGGLDFWSKRWMENPHWATTEVRRLMAGGARDDDLLWVQGKREEAIKMRERKKG